MFVDCAVCQGPRAWLPQEQCAVCCTTGAIPWESLSAAGRQAALAAGRYPWRWEQVAVPWSDLEVPA